MFHKTLNSYYKGEPWDATEEHPDGPLWLITREELDVLPQGLHVERIDGKTVVLGKDDVDLDTRQGYLAYGIRGYKDD